MEKRKPTAPEAKPAEPDTSVKIAEALRGQSENSLIVLEVSQAIKEQISKMEEKTDESIKSAIAGVVAQLGQEKTIEVTATRKDSLGHEIGTTEYKFVIRNKRIIH